MKKSAAVILSDTHKALQTTIVPISSCSIPVSQTPPHFFHQPSSLNPSSAMIDMRNNPWTTTAQIKNNSATDHNDNEMQCLDNGLAQVCESIRFLEID